MSGPDKPNLNDNERRVLRALPSEGYAGFGFVSFAYLTRETMLNRRAVRLACRSLARKGLAEYSRGLWSEDGKPCGAGYARTWET
jgi:hypothetical protein